VGRIEKRVLAFYGRSLTGSCAGAGSRPASGWSASPHGRALHRGAEDVPAARRQRGGQRSVHRPEGSSPAADVRAAGGREQGHPRGPAVDRSISVTGLSAFSPRPGPHLRLSQARQAAAQLRGRGPADGASPASRSLPFLRPYPVLQISTGATSQNQGQYAFSISGVNPDQVYEASDKLMAKLRTYRGFASLSSDRFNHTPESRDRHPAGAGQGAGVSEARILALLRNAYSPELPVPDQEARRSVPGDPRGPGQGARHRRGSLAALYQVRRRQEPAAAQRAGEVAHDPGTTGREPPEPVHQRHHSSSTSSRALR